MNTKKFLKLYAQKREQSLEKWGYAYPPDSRSEFERDLESIYQNHLQSFDNDVRKSKIYLSLLGDGLKYFGYFAAFSEQNYDMLNDVLWQDGRARLLSSATTASGTSYTGGLFDALFTCLACNDYEPLDAFLPANLPLLDGRYYTENLANLAKSLYHGQDLNEPLARAEKFLTKKITAYEKYYVEFFVALARKDAVGISTSLQELCAAYQRQGYPVEKIDKCFASELHGLYRLVRFFDEELFSAVKMPDHECFFADFELWQSQNGYPKGGQIYRYGAKTEYMNRLLCAKIPTFHLYDRGKEKIGDTERFARDLTSAATQN